MRGGLAEQIVNYFLLGSSFLLQHWALPPLVKQIIKVPFLKASGSAFWEYVILLRCLMCTYTYLYIYTYIYIQTDMNIMFVFVFMFIFTFTFIHT